jgi:hypothetical protein
MPLKSFLKPPKPRCEKAGLTADDVAWIVPHQANLRIITRTAQKMGVGMDRVVVTVQDHGNTSAASIRWRCRSRWATGGSNRATCWWPRPSAGALPGVRSSCAGSDHPPLKEWRANPCIDLRNPSRILAGNKCGGRDPMAGKTLTRMDLSEAVFREVGLSRNESAQLVERVLEMMSDALVEGNR